MKTAVEEAVAVAAADLVVEAVEVVAVATAEGIEAMETDVEVVGMIVEAETVVLAAVTAEVGVTVMVNKVVLDPATPVLATGPVLILAAATQTLPGEIPATVVRHLSLEAAVVVMEVDMEAAAVAAQ